MTTPDLKRKKSVLAIFKQPADTSRPSTPATSRSGQRLASGGVRSLMSRLRDSQALTPPPTPSSTLSSVESSKTPDISRATKAFADSLNAAKLSNFLVWMAYYDLVELPDAPTSWFTQIDAMEMRGWIALGAFLTEVVNAEVSYGFGLIVLDSICDRLELSRSTVHGYLRQIANSQAMAYTSMAHVVKQAETGGKSSIETLEDVLVKLHDLGKLVVHLTPSEGSMFHYWQPLIMKRIQGFSIFVIAPRVALFRSGAPVLLSSTCGQLAREEQESLNLKYLYEAMQQKRIVPLHLYGTLFHNNDSTATLHTPPASPTFQCTEDDVETQRARDLSIALMKENQDLRLRFEALQTTHEKLAQANEKLVMQLADLRAANRKNSVRDVSKQVLPPTLPVRSLSIKKPGNLVPEQTLLPRVRPRSVSLSAVPTLTEELNCKLKVHHRAHSEELSTKYSDVFAGLEPSPSAMFRLTCPGFTTGFLNASPASLPLQPATVSPDSFNEDEWEDCTDTSNE